MSLNRKKAPLLDMTVDPKKYAITNKFRLWCSCSCGHVLHRTVNIKYNVIEGQDLEHLIISELRDKVSAGACPKCNKEEVKYVDLSHHYHRGGRGRKSK